MDEQQNDHHAIWLYVFEKAPQFNISDRYFVYRPNDMMYFEKDDVIDVDGFTKKVWIMIQVDKSFLESLRFSVGCGVWHDSFLWKEIDDNKRLRLCRMMFGEPSIKWLTYSFPSERFTELAKWFYDHKDALT